MSGGRRPGDHGSWFYAANVFKGVVLVGVVVWAIVSAIKSLM